MVLETPAAASACTSDAPIKSLTASAPRTSAPATGAVPMLTDAATRAAPAAVPRLNAMRRALRLMSSVQSGYVAMDAHWVTAQYRRPARKFLRPTPTDRRPPEPIPEGLNLCMRLSFY